MKVERMQLASLPRERYRVEDESLGERIIAYLKADEYSQGVLRTRIKKYLRKEYPRVKSIDWETFRVDGAEVSFLSDPLI